MQFGQTIIPFQPLRLEQPEAQLDEQTNDKEMVFRSFESNNTVNKSTIEDQANNDFGHENVLKTNKNEKKPQKRQPKTIRSSIESCGVLKRNKSPLTQQNIAKINHVLPVHKYIRIKQWVNFGDKENTYPFPFFSM